MVVEIYRQITDEVNLFPRCALGYWVSPPTLFWCNVLHTFIQIRVQHETGTPKSAITEQINGDLIIWSIFLRRSLCIIFAHTQRLVVTIWSLSFCLCVQRQIVWNSLILWRFLLRMYQCAHPRPSYCAFRMSPIYVSTLWPTWQSWVRDYIHLNDYDYLELT